MIIIPSILVKSKIEFLKELNGIKNSCKLVQLDIADGKFVPNKTWADPNVINQQKINFELHFMVNNPELELLKWRNIKNIKRVYIPFETTKNWPKIFALSKNNHWQLGVVLNPDTPANVIKKYLPTIKFVLFMGVYPGFQGQKLIPAVLAKIKTFKKQNPKIFTALDGATNEQTLPKIIKSGVDAIGPGSAIFKNERTPKENLTRMKKLINNLTRQK